MIDPLDDVVIALACVVAAVTGVLAYLRRDTPRWLFLATVGTGVLAIAQAVAGTVLTIIGPRPDETATFLGYALSTALVLPAALLWSRAEPGRWGNGVLCVGCLTLAVMIVRMNQIWAMGGA
ncbi:MAG: hypothetical protein H0T85_07350 [Geodermatophilaceae bacterium]|nr:hypothetical protein [Geodermatophilaceae bacterium]